MTLSARFAPILGFLSSLLLLAPGCRHGEATPTSAAAAGEPITWVELGPAGAVSARAIVSGACPELLVDSAPVAMRERAPRSEPDYPVSVCEALIPAGARAASIAGKALALPRPNPTRIVVIGDTGCRLKGLEAQACNDPQAWPFRSVAEAAASAKPDLVIHVGDYIYRESPCPPLHPGCAGSPYGPSWKTWQADFFQPAAPLLRAAPWVFVRGNHETCKRPASEGWFRFLYPGDRPASCQDFTEPYAVSLGNLQLLVMDTSNITDGENASSAVDAYRRQFDALRAAASGNAWHLMHHPLWAVRERDGKLMQVTDALQEASGDSLAPGVKLVLTGHVHIFEALSFEGSRPAAIIAGNSGTQLTTDLPASPVGETIRGSKVERASWRDAFGFMVMTATSGTDWQLSIRDAAGNEAMLCGLTGTKLTCTPPRP